MIEQSLSDNLAPNRDIGAILYGEVLGGGITYQAGLLQGTPDNSSNPDTDQGKEGVARLFFQPFIGFESPLKGLGLGAAGTLGHADGSNVNTSVGTELPTYVTAGQDPILTYKTGVTQTGSRSTSQHRRTGTGGASWVSSGSSWSPIARWISASMGTTCTTTASRAR